MFVKKRSQETDLSPVELRALTQIRNLIVHRGQAPSVRELAAALAYKSPRSAAVIIERLIEAGWLARRAGGKLQLLRHPPDDIDHARTVAVPLVGSASCGSPLLAVENTEAMIHVSIRLAPPPRRYFLLRAKGDSMNEAGIEDGDLVLVRQQQTATDGDRVVALIDDEATIKEFRRGAGVVTLRPCSRNPAHRPIVLTHDFLVQGVVVATIPKMT